MRKLFTVLAFLLFFAAGAMAQSMTPTDTIDINFDNAMRNGVNDYIAYYGLFQIVGGDSSNTYCMNLEVYSDQIAGSYTSSDICWENTVFKKDDLAISINEVRDFTVSGNIDTCSTFLEIISTDSVLYRISFVYPGVVYPVPTIDTVDITMNSPSTSMYDGTATYGFYQLHGYSVNGEYYMNLGVRSDQIAGSYTCNDVMTLYTLLLHFVGEDSVIICLSDIRDFTVSGDASACSTYVEMVSVDSVLYRINYVYSGTPSGIDNTTETEYVVYNEGNVIVVTGAEGETITVYDLFGKTISHKKTVSDVERIEIAVPGVYEVRIGNRTFKALVK